MIPKPVDDIYNWVKENKVHYYLSKYEIADLRHDTNNMVIGRFNDETNRRPIIEFIALNPKVLALIV